MGTVELITQLMTEFSEELSMLRNNFQETSKDIKHEINSQIKDLVRNYNDLTFKLEAIEGELKSLKNSIIITIPKEVLELSDNAKFGIVKI